MQVRVGMKFTGRVSHSKRGRLFRVKTGVRIKFIWDVTNNSRGFFGCKLEHAHQMGGLLFHEEQMKVSVSWIFCSLLHIK